MPGISQKTIGGYRIYRLTAVLCFALLAREVAAQLKINEVYYHTDGPQEPNQFIEIINAGTNTEYLDGKIITDEAGSGIEGIFQFPGTGTDYPVAPGEVVVIAADADGSDGYDPDLSSLADWECYTGSGDYDNPAVLNLNLVGGQLELSLYAGGDNVILGDGSDTSAPIDAGTILDGVNFAGGGGELAPLAPGAGDSDPSVSAPSGYSLGRCPDGWDTDYSSENDFQIMSLSPGQNNECTTTVQLFVNDTTVYEGDSGSTTAVFQFYLSEPAADAVSVEYATSPGTAAAGLDFEEAWGVVYFPPGYTNQEVSVVVYGDTNREDNETFYIQLSNAVGAILADPQGAAVILDDDGFYILSITASETQAWIVWEAYSGRTYRLEYTPQLSNPVWNAYGEPVTATGTTAGLSDTSISNVSRRFYRVVKED